MLEVVAGGHGNVTAPPVGRTSSSLVRRGRRRGRAHRTGRVPAAGRARLEWRPALADAAHRGGSRGRGAGRCRGADLHVDAGPGGDRPGAAAGRFRGRLAGPEDRVESPAAPGRVHARRRARGLRRAARTGHRGSRARRGAALSPHAAARPACGSCCRCRARSASTGSGRKGAGRVRAAAGDAQDLIDTERYVDYAADVRVAGIRQAAEIEPKLTPGWSKVTVETDPAGARVFVAGKERGIDAAPLDLDAGSYQRRTAARWLQAMGDRRAGEGQRAAADRTGETRPAGRTPRRAQSPRRCERHDRRRVPRPHAARAGRAARPAQVVA